MHTGGVACCPLASHDEYVVWTDRQTDGCQTVALRFPLGTRPAWCRLILRNCKRLQSMAAVSL